MEIERKVTFQAVDYNNVEILSPLIREKLYVYRHNISTITQDKIFSFNKLQKRGTNDLKGVAYKHI